MPTCLLSACLLPTCLLPTCLLSAYLPSAYLPSVCCLLLACLLPAFCLPAFCLPAFCLPAFCLPAFCLPAGYLLLVCFTEGYGERLVFKDEILLNLFLFCAGLRMLPLQWIFGRQLEFCGSDNGSIGDQTAIVDRVQDMMHLCFGQDPGRTLTLCLSDTAAMSRSKWLISR